MVMVSDVLNTNLAVDDQNPPSEVLPPKSRTYVIYQTAKIVIFSVFLSFVLTTSSYYLMYGADDVLYSAALFSIIIPALCSLPVGWYITLQKQKVLELNSNLVRSSFELEQLNEALQYEATHDAMTKLLNRGSFLSKLEDRFNSSASDVLLLIDIDHFKSINDQYGHHQGDEAILIVTSIIDQISGPDSSVGRVGGEEFAVLLHDVSLESAIKVAEMTRREIEQAKFTPKQGKAHKLTVSIGIALLKDSDRRYPMRKADAALYAAKEDGRNKIAVHYYPGDGYKLAS